MENRKKQKKVRFAVTKKELELKNRSISFPLLISILDSILFVTGLVLVFSTINTMRESLLSDYRTFLYIYVSLAFFAFITVLMIAPLFTAASIAGERQSKTFDLLLTTLLTPIDLVTEKMLSALVTLIVISFSFLPAICLSLIFGGINFAAVFILFISFLPGIFLVLSAGFFASSLSQTATYAIASGYGITMALLFGPILVSLLTRSFVAEGTNRLVYLLLLDPLYTVTVVLGHQIGESRVTEEIMQFLSFDADQTFLTYSVLISVIVQILLGIGFLLMAVINIMPGGPDLSVSKDS